MSTLLQQLKQLLSDLQSEKMRKWNRRVSVGDLLNERHDIAAQYGFGEGTTCYDNVLILGDVKVGRDCWVGPNVILDGSGGGLLIGDSCHISAGVHIYTHQTVRRALTMGKAPIEKAPTRLGDGVYVGPNSIIGMGVVIGDRVVIGSLSFVDKDIASDMKAYGCPARVVGPSHGDD